MIMPRIRVPTPLLELTEPQIERLVLQYTREMARYEKAAEIVANRLRRELRAEARLRHLISFRAKHPDDLQGKLRRKAADPKSDPKYRDYDELRDNLNDVVTDLAGVRVVVYVPEDELRIVALIDRIFKFPDREDAQPARHDKPSGYQATHRLVVASDNPDELSVGDAICEIQVTTLAAHLFNELEHDITYKEHGQQPSLNERAILEQVLRMVRVSDYLLNSLLTEHRLTTRNHAVLNDPESLRFVLEHEAGRPLAGDFVRLFKMLEGVVNPLNPVTLSSLGEVKMLLEAGRSKASDLGLDTNADDVIHYALALNRYHEDFLEQVTTWRGPETSLKRAILALKQEVVQDSTTMTTGQEASNA
jgi:ppGpp synthetase/RelA/SpoT-type nucleotidyltranferase